MTEIKPWKERQLKDPSSDKWLMQVEIDELRAALAKSQPVEQASIEKLIDQLISEAANDGFKDRPTSDATLEVKGLLLAAFKPVEQGKPVAWQYRMRPDWEKDWQQGWMYCSKGAFEDYTRAPLLHDWHYEVRELFTHVRPMSEAQIIQWMPVGLLRTEEFVYQKGIKDAEKFHGIKGATE